METKSQTIELVVNGKPVSAAAASLADIVRLQALGNARVATAVNGEFIPAAERARTALKTGDRVEIVSARQGG